MHQDNYLVTLYVPLCHTAQALELHQCVSTSTELHACFVNGGEFRGTVSKQNKSFGPPHLPYILLFFKQTNHIFT